ncbi:MAG: hydantoinase/oxoprolinase family protein [Treponema sp.]|nr:hydantoinase/oxoprolinase family protein [Treponema sp.]
MDRTVRIGIDVGGTFTDAIALDNTTYEIVGIKKLHTTHQAKEGVIRGVIDVLHTLLEEIHVSPDNVVFIAHGTTQATNALLEGDVANIAILGMAKGLEGLKARRDTQIGNIPLAEGKKIETQYMFLNSTNGVDEKQVTDVAREFLKNKLNVAVCAEAFSVDDPSNEKKAVEIMNQVGMIATATNEISKLYGLRARTRTAVINASILPKMMLTADMTAQAVRNTNISAPMMIMRSDGGVMQIDEVRSRPLLTVLSGPAAGVAGALMYEKISDGIFLEVGGTSTDISAIQNGKVMTKYAKIGGHSTYITSLDINTVGIAGGSVIRIKDNKIADVGPRSAHIAGLDYAIFADLEILRAAKVENFRPVHLDTYEYLGIRSGDKRYAVTTTCAANYLGLIPPGDYAYASEENGKVLFEILAGGLGSRPEAIAWEIMDIAAGKVIPAVEEFIRDYHLNRSYLILTGGGGGASAIVPAVAKKIGLKYKIAKNAPVISTIGAALAMVRDSVERTIVNPTQDDIMKLRAEAEYAVMKAGASKESVQVTIEIDAAKSIVKAIAVGTTDLSANTSVGKQLSCDQLQDIAEKNLGGGNPESVSLLFENDLLTVFLIERKVKKFFGILNLKQKLVCVLDRHGVIKLTSENSVTRLISVGKMRADLSTEVESNAIYDESGENMPDVYLIVGGKIVDFSGLETIEQIVSLSMLEIEGLENDYKVYAIIKRRSRI